MIRQATAGDVTALARLRIAMDAEEGVEVQPGFEEDFVKWSASKLSHFTVFVAQDEDTLVGNVWLEKVERVPRPSHDNGPMGYVTNFYVERAHRNRGIGRCLLEAVVEHATAGGLSLLIASPSSRSEPLWRRTGFGTTDFLEMELPSSH